MQGNQRSTPIVARTPEQIENALRDGVAAFAAKLLELIPANRRSGPETSKLADIKRKRQHASAENQAFLLWMARRTNEPVCLLSECIRLYEVEAAAAPICAFDASLSETIAQGPLDQAQQLAAHEDTPTRWIVVAEVARTHYEAIRRLADAAVKRASLLSHARNV